MRRIRGFVAALIIVGALAVASPAKATVLPTLFNGRIAYVHNNNEIYTSFLDGAIKRRVGYGTNPTWGPQGGHLAYSYQGDIWTMRPDGFNKQRLFDIDELVTDLDWSPDGKSFAWMRELAGYDWEVRAQSIGDLAPHSLDFELAGGLPARPDSVAWTPDSKVVAGHYQYSPQYDFRTANVDGTGVEERMWDVFEAESMDTTPDGRIVYTNHTRVYVQNGSSFDSFEFPGSGTVHDVAVSPDGEWIVVSQRESKYDNGLWISHLDGSLARQITSGNDRSPSWQPSLIELPNLLPRALGWVQNALPNWLFANGTASLDGEGAITTYAWDWGDGSKPSTIRYGWHLYARPGTYVVRLTVTDESGHLGTRTFNVTIT